MPIQLIAELQPKGSFGPGDFALLDDAYLRGGFHICANLTDRNNIPVDRRKHGMRVFVQTTDIVYILSSDLTTWTSDPTLTTNLQDAYNHGAEILTVPGGPVVLTGPDTTSRIFTIRNLTTDILKVSVDKTIEFTKQLKGKEYTSNITSTINTNSSDIIMDTTDKNEYRAIQYFYTISNSDNSGFETGQLYLVHDGLNVVLYAIMGSYVGVPSGVTFQADITAYNVNLKATSDNSVFSRLIHLFKIALT